MNKFFTYLNYVLLFIISLGILVMGNIIFDNPIESKLSDLYIENYFLKHQNLFQVIHQDIWKGNLMAKSFYDLTPEELQHVIIQSYNDNGLNNPCQFYSYLWKLYFEYHKYSTEYVFIDGHVFLIAQNKNLYYLADQTRLEKIQFQ